MPRYKSGNAIVRFDLVKITDDRKLKYNFIIRIEDNDDFIVIVDDYECPMNWSEEQIASDILSWGLHLAGDDYRLYNEIEFNECISNEDIPKVEELL